MTYLNPIRLMFSPTAKYDIVLLYTLLLCNFTSVSPMAKYTDIVVKLSTVDTGMKTRVATTSTYSFTLDFSSLAVPLVNKPLF